MPNLFVICGHGAGDPGAVGKNCTEAERVRTLASRIKRFGGDNVIIGDTNKNWYKSKLVNNTNIPKGSLVLELHMDSSPNKSAKGAHIVIDADFEADKYDEALAKFISGIFPGRADTIVRRNNLANLNSAQAAKINYRLMECGFISNEGDVATYNSRMDEIAKGILTCFNIAWKEESVVSEKKGEQTVMKIPDDVYVQEINPKDFRFKVCDCKKRDIDIPKYFNAGFFSSGEKAVVPVGNLACNGKIITQAKDNEGWMQTSKKKMTTIYTTKEGKCGIAKTDRLDSIIGLKDAISGIPIIVGGKKVSMEDIKAEGYFGNELYNTWHGFLGIRNGKLVYVAMKCEFNEMCWTLVALGIYDAIKLDGGGSFILHDEKELVGTSENRRIHNIGIWTQ
jgi:hypothetical protein